MEVPEARTPAAAKVTPRDWRWLRCLLVACIVVAASYNLLWWTLLRPTNPMTVAQVEQLIASAMQSGDSRAQVEALLAAKRLPYSYLDGKQEDLGLDSEVERTGVPIGEIGGAIIALIPDTARSFLTTEDIGLTFVFDRKGRLIRHQVRAIYTGM